MQRFLLTLGFLLWFASSALALPSYCTLTGTVLSPDGTACAGCKITITTAVLDALDRLLLEFTPARCAHVGFTLVARPSDSLALADSLSITITP